MNNSDLHSFICGEFYNYLIKLFPEFIIKINYGTTISFVDPEVNDKDDVYRNHPLLTISFELDYIAVVRSMTRTEFKTDSHATDKIRDHIQKYGKFVYYEDPDFEKNLLRHVELLLDEGTRLRTEEINLGEVTFLNNSCEHWFIENIFCILLPPVIAKRDRGL